jgi:hypothetical protein
VRGGACGAPGLALAEQHQRRRVAGVAGAHRQLQRGGAGCGPARGLVGGVDPARRELGFGQQAVPVGARGRRDLRELAAAGDHDLGAATLVVAGARTPGRA